VAGIEAAPVQSVPFGNGRKSDGVIKFKAHVFVLVNLLTVPFLSLEHELFDAGRLRMLTIADTSMWGEPCH
jgi:hypothetical protein